MFITYEMLDDAGACEEQRDLFWRLFPDGVEVTEELCVKYAHDFDFEWAANELLSSAARRAYQEAEESATETYRVTARQAHRQAYMEAGEVKREVRGPAWETYKEAVASARQAYQEAVARAFARAAALEPQTEK